MWETISDNPWWSGIAIYAILIVIVLILGMRRRSRRDVEERPRVKLAVDDRMSMPLKRVAEVLNEKLVPEPTALRDEAALLLHRMPMQSRFVPDGNSGLMRDLALADQIVADQHIAHEEPGKPVDVPAPGEEGYVEPAQIVHVSVERYTVILNRGQPTSVSEARPDGAEWPAAPVPEEWEAVVVALAMEVLRLREGWSVTEPL